MVFVLSARKMQKIPRKSRNFLRGKMEVLNAVIILVTNDIVLQVVRLPVIWKQNGKRKKNKDERRKRKKRKLKKNG